MQHLRFLIAALVVAAAVVAAQPAVVSAEHAEPAASLAHQASPEAGRGAGPESPAAKEPEQGRDEHGSGWMAVIAKAFNFAILVGVLVYFLRTPLMDYLGGRITKVREDLVTAAATREAATRRLSEIHAQLAALPAELEALKVRGAEEIAAERVRIAQAAEAERQRLLEHTRREIETQLRVARRDLIEHAATLAVEVASGRIRAAITPDDQARLLDRYTAQVAGPEPGRGASPEARS